MPFAGMASTTSNGLPFNRRRYFDEVRLLPKAYEDLENIWRYTVEQWSTQQAIIYVDELNTTFKRLLDNPLLNRERTEFSPPVRIVPYASHLIVYLADEHNTYRVVFSTTNLCELGHLYQTIVYLLKWLRALPREDLACVGAHAFGAGEILDEEMLLYARLASKVSAPRPRTLMKTFSGTCDAMKPVDLSQCQLGICRHVGDDECERILA